MKNENRHISNVDYWQADILSAYDYSPFGVMLTGRTFEKEETVQVCHNETTLTTTPVLEEGFGSWFTWTTMGSALLTYVNGEMQVSNPSNSSNNIGASKTFTTGSGVHSVSFDIIDNTCATIVLWPPSVTPKTINVYIRDNANNVVASGAYTTAGNYSLSFTPATTGATYKIEFYMASASAFCYYRVDNVLITYQSEQITQVCEQVSRSGKYPYSFQNQERDDEIIKGYVNFQYRGYDPRLGRLNWATDPLAKEYPWNSPYAFSENVVINAVELEGLEKVEVYNWAYSSAIKKNEMTYSHSYTDKNLVGDYIRVDDYNGKGKIEKQVWKDKQWKNTSVITEDDIAYALRNNKPIIPINRNITSPYVSAFEYSTPIAKEMYEMVVPDAVGVTVGTGAHAGGGITTNVGFVFFTKGKDFGFHGIHVKTAGVGLESNLGLNFFGGYYNGNKNDMKKDFGGIGYQIGGDIILGGGVWTSLKDNYTPGWTGISLGLGLSGGSSADVTKTEYLEKKVNSNEENK